VAVIDLTPGSASSPGVEVSEKSDTGERQWLTPKTLSVSWLSKAIAVATRDDKGLRMTIEVVLYDNGGVMVNGHYFKSKSSSAALGAGTQILGMLSTMEQDLHRRLAKK
jgi:hypothetical protein